MTRQAITEVLMDKKCEAYNRCMRCRKLNFKRETTKYQNMRKELFENGLRDSCGNLIVCDSFIKSLLNQRAKLGRLARGIENARRKIRER